jgi:hypothetical protein
MDDNKARTHIAYALRRESRTRFSSLEIGKGRCDDDGTFHGYLDRLPIGGFTGYVQFVPVGKDPSLPTPQRPDPSGEEEKT